MQVLCFCPAQVHFIVPTSAARNIIGKGRHMTSRQLAVTVVGIRTRWRVHQRTAAGIWNEGHEPSRFKVR